MLKAIYHPDVPFETLYIPHILKEIYFDRVYEDVVSRHNRVIIDVGANIGLVSMYLRQFADKVYAIEPATEHFEALRQNKLRNGWDNVELAQLAIADRDGMAQFYINSGNHTMNSLVFGGDQNHTVDTRTLETFMNERSIDYVDFIKMDVEGAEDLILGSEGFRNVLERVGSIEIEFHARGWEKWNALFEEHGFALKQFPTDATVVYYYRREHE